MSEVDRQEQERNMTMDVVDHQEFENSNNYLSILGSKDRDFLLSPSGDQVKISELEGKVIGVYFSANWHPPCHKFNQLLINAYEHFKIHDDNVNPGFEIVFVSSDEDSNAFNNFREGMPWPAIPFSDLSSKRSLTAMFDVEGIPCLVILQPGGPHLVVRDGVELLQRYGIQAFPFTEERVMELQEKEREKRENQTLGNLLTNQSREFLLSHSASNQVPVASLEGKTVGLYFSAQWCFPGVKFTSKLISMYQKIKQILMERGDQEEDFEIVFVSTDRDESSFNSFFETMPWLALPFNDSNVKTLTKHFDIQWIPSLIILGPDGKTVTDKGRNLVNLYQENAYPFTAAKTAVLEQQMEEEAKCLPKNRFHSGHRHELALVSEGSGGGGAYICCDCDEQGLGWAYQCMECGYEVHPKCINPVVAMVS